MFFLCVNDHTITYDAIGNPLEYRYGEFFSWQNGRQLEYFESMSGYSGKVGGVYFEYDADGYRARKEGTGGFLGVTEYLYSGGLLLRETRMSLPTNTTVYDLYFTYDEAGRPFSVSSYGETLYYFYDIYGNVKYLYDAYGNLVAEYTYRDPWGGDVELTCHYFEGYWIAELNPFTYKGYYYDADLDLYYCSSRYYDPETCRWINADGYVSTGQGVLGNNMYAYCGNNPVMYIDLEGKSLERTAGFGGGGGLCYAGGYSGGGGGGGGVSVSPPFPRPSAKMVAGIITVALAVSALPLSTDVARREYISIRQRTRAEEKEEEAEKTKPKAPSFHIHHVVAKKDYRAEESREILREVGIEPTTDIQNLLILPQNYHASLHTTAYHNYITERLQAVAGNREAIELTLLSLKGEILVRSTLGIRWD